MTHKDIYQALVDGKAVRHKITGSMYFLDDMGFLTNEVREPVYSINVSFPDDWEIIEIPKEPEELLFEGLQKILKYCDEMHLEDYISRQAVEDMVEDCLSYYQEVIKKK